MRIVNSNELNVLIATNFPISSYQLTITDPANGNAPVFFVPGTLQPGSILPQNPQNGLVVSFAFGSDVLDSGAGVMFRAQTTQSFDSGELWDLTLTCPLIDRVIC